VANLSREKTARDYISVLDELLGGEKLGQDLAA
jgi:hypothetical protein